VKEKRSYKRFDLISALAVLGVLLVLFFEAIFIFEFYRVDYAKIEPYLPAPVKEWLESAVPQPLPPAKPETEPGSEESVGAAETNAVVSVEEEVFAAETVEETSQTEGEPAPTNSAAEALAEEISLEADEDPAPADADDAETAPAGEEPVEEEPEPAPSDEHPVPVG
jgi:hypothetical protein